MSKVRQTCRNCGAPLSAYAQLHRRVCCSISCRDEDKKKYQAQWMRDTNRTARTESMIAEWAEEHITIVPGEFCYRDDCYHAYILDTSDCLSHKAFSLRLSKILRERDPSWEHDPKATVNGVYIWQNLKYTA